MTRRKTHAAIAILLMAVFFAAGCQAGGGTVPSTTEEKAVSAFRAMAQAADVTSPSGDEYTVRNFIADDGSVINGTFRMDSAGNVLEADLEMTLANNQVIRFAMVPETGSTEPVITVDDTTVPDAVIPDLMTDEERRAFMLFLIGFDEAQDEIRDEIEDVFEHLEDSAPGEYKIPSDRPGISGTVIVDYEERGDDDTEVVGGNVVLSGFSLGGGNNISGSYSFTSRDDYEDAEMDITISSFTDDGITLSNVRIDGRITESELYNDDRFEFRGSISGMFSARRGGSVEVSFSGKMDAMEDRYLRFPEYDLRIDSKQVAIGREDATPFRR